MVEKMGAVERGAMGKYRWFTATGGINYFMGKNGAVRSGVNVSESVSLTDIVHARMKVWEGKNDN